MFARVNKKTASNAVIDQVMRSISLRQLQIGDRLPSEEKMVELFGVGRSTVREALKALEVLGLVRRGKDGAFVESDSPFGALSQHLHMEVSAKQIEVKHLYQARRLLELEMAEMAASQIRDSDVDELTNLCTEMKDTATEAVNEYIALDRAFHRRISEIAGNPFLTRMWELTYDLYLEMRRRAGITGAVRRNSDKRHSELVRALATRDPALARSTMAKSLDIGEKSMSRNSLDANEESRSARRKAD